MRPILQLALLISLAAVAGVACVIAPYVAVHGIDGTYQAPLFPLLRNSWEKLQLIPTIILLLGVGGVLGFIRPMNWLVLGASTVILFPLAAILEMLVDSGSHNLWPIEFVLYGIFIAGPALVGAFFGFIFARERKNAT